MATDADIKIAFIGDSHTNGYIGNLDPSKGGDMWNDNNYAEIYIEQNDIPGAVYAMGGATNRVFVNWAKNVLEKFKNLETLVIQLTYPSRFIIAFDSFRKDLINTDYLCETVHREGNLIRLMDYTLLDDVVQAFFKPAVEDWDKFPGIGASMEDGLSHPDIWHSKYFDIKLFFELNTWLEKQDHMMWLYTIDNMCKEKGVNLHFFKMKPDTFYNFDINYYGNISGKLHETPVSEYFKKKMIDHNDFLLDDTEHYNKDYHNLIAEKFLPYILGK